MMNKLDSQPWFPKTKTIVTVAIVLALVLLAYMSTVSVGAGEKVRTQNTFSGVYAWHQTEGIKFVAPFMTKVSRYADVVTLAITDDDQILDVAGATRDPMPITFIDNYGGYLEATFRLKLPADPERLELMHQDVKSMDNLKGNTYQTFGKNLILLTVDQFRAQDFMQGGKGQFKQRLNDQARFGMLVTKRERIPYEVESADQKLDADDRITGKTTKQFVDKVIIQLDKDGEPLRRPHGLMKYGIEVSQADLGEFHPDADLIEYISEVKKRERERGQVLANQGLERDKAVSESLAGARQRITSSNKLNIEKDRAVIKEQELTEVAQEQKKRSTAVKERELAISVSNLKIEEANYKSAVFQAKAELELGLAKAKITRANYQAIDKEVLRLEVDKAKALALYKSNMNVTMPTIMSGTGDSGNSIANMSSLKLLELLGSPVNAK